jgi:hypothetical protein
MVVDRCVYVCGYSKMVVDRCLIFCVKVPLNQSKKCTLYHSLIPRHPGDMAKLVPNNTKKFRVKILPYKKK